MKKIYLLLIGGFCFQTMFAQSLPKWANKAKKAVFSVVTYNKDNQILNTGNGFYIDESGTAVSDYTLFKGAHHAVVVTADGKELPVKCIMGANDLYDVVKFKTETDKKTVALQPASQAVPQGATVYLLPYSTQKAVNGQSGSVEKVDTIGNNAYYYTIQMQTGDKTVSCPIMNAEGEVLGLIQKNADAESKVSYAVGISYVSSLSINALSGNDYTLNSIGIKKGLPEDESQALVYLYMMSSQLNREQYLELLNDFIAQYPRNMEGYQRRAALYMEYRDDTHNALAVQDLEHMLEVASKPDEAHFNIAKLLYNYQINLNGAQAYASWTYERALEEINKALEIAQEGVYYQVQGDIYFAMQKYAEAYASYEKVNQSSMASATTFYAAAKTKELIKDVDKNEVITLMDSAVARFNEPYGKDAAPYLYERARMKNELKKYREAVIDYNHFYDAMMGQVSAEFYLIREQAEMQCRMYQQAINDINKAVELEPKNVDLWIEKGGVHLRVNQAEEAMKALCTALSLDPKNAPAYRMLGYCQVQQKNTKEGIANLQKAKELGDTVADELLKKYSK